MYVQPEKKTKNSTFQSSPLCVLGSAKGVKKEGQRKGTKDDGN